MPGYSDQDCIETSFVEHHKTYGPQRMSKILNEMGIPIGRTRVRRLMNECNLVPVTRRPFIKTTDSSHKKKSCPDLVNRDFAADKPNRIWTSDITYIWTMEGFVYLAVFLMFTQGMLSAGPFVKARMPR